MNPQILQQNQSGKNVLHGLRLIQFSRQRGNLTGQVGRFWFGILDARGKYLIKAFF